MTQFRDHRPSWPDRTVPGPVGHGQPGPPPYPAGPVGTQQPWMPYPGPGQPGGPYPGPAAGGRTPGPYPSPPAGPPARPHARYPAPPPAPPARPRRGRRALLVFVLLVVALFGVAAVAVATRPEPVRVADTGAIEQPGTLSVFELQPGDCYNPREAPPPPGQTQPISFVEAVACTSPHSSQVVTKIPYGLGDTRESVLGGRADADCSREFQAKLDPSAFTDPTLKPGRLAPADDPTWLRNRAVACVVFSETPISRTLLR
jgi:hypothetical protein